MYVEVIGSHGNAISPLASLPRLLPLFPLRVASFPQAHLLPPLSLRSPRVSRPPGTCKYMVAWKLKRWQIFIEHVSTKHEIWVPFRKLHDMPPYQQKASKSHGE